MLLNQSTDIDFNLRVTILKIAVSPFKTITESAVYVYSWQE